MASVPTPRGRYTRMSKAKAKVKETLGWATGDRHVEAEGKAEEGEGQEESRRNEMIYKRGGHWHVDVNVTVHGVRYREALDTTDKREALALEKKRVGEILAGKAASKSGREFGRKPFGEAAKLFLEDRKGHVSERTPASSGSAGRECPAICQDWLCS